ncbi:hypothetical protein HPB48_002459 [Haemaphysalis longicornis]|uniref:Uncharacterized protein n=1 Tax=Haemaphysalis longicornis TaxID=44386 RepID=A0A9J6FX80_HAELO|nr:hypothetical protein HPB48_002459 [Haemaphysalis longicornis]
MQVANDRRPTTPRIIQAVGRWSSNIRHYEHPSEQQWCSTCRLQPVTSSSSNQAPSEGEGGVNEGASASIAAIGEELHKITLDKEQRPGGNGSRVETDGIHGATAARPRQDWGLLSTIGSLEHHSETPGGAFGTYRRPFASSSLDAVWSGGPFGASWFPQATTLRRPQLAPASRPLRPPTTATSTPDPDRCRQYLTIRKSPYVYQTDDWREMNMSLYFPLDSDLMINTYTVDQISYDSSYFFLGDSTGNYAGSSNGALYITLR